MIYLVTMIHNLAFLNNIFLIKTFQSEDYSLKINVIMVCTNLKAQHKHPLIYGSCCSILILLSLQIFHYKNHKLEHEGVVCKRQRGMNNFLMFNSYKEMRQKGLRVTIPIVDIINVKLIRWVLHFITKECDDCLYKMQFSLSHGITIIQDLRVLCSHSNPF